MNNRDNSLRFLMVIVFSLTLSASSYAADSLCEAVATKAIKSAAGYDDLATEFDLKKGKRISVITRYIVSKKSGKAVYCSHGGGCYPADAMKLMYCKVDLRAPEYEDDDTLEYSLILERDKIDPETLRAYDIEEKLRGYGMCNACAPGAVDAYLERPNSKCGKLVRRALEGSPEAQKKLSDDNGPC